MSRSISRDVARPFGAPNRMSRAAQALAIAGAIAMSAMAAPCVEAAQPQAGQKPTDPLRLASGSIEALVGRVSRSVVQVVVSGYQPVDSNGRTDVALGRGRVIGSGMVIESPGYVLTNAHVVAGAERIQVIVEGDGAQTLGRQTARIIEARLIGVSDELDLALLKIDADDIPVLRLADYDGVRQGELVFALGSPDGLRNSVSMGMVSSVARQVTEDSPLVYVQTDASINPGNSGGPLVDASGDVVGINTFIQTLSGGSEGLGFALPSALIALAFPQLRDYGHLHRGLIGLTVQTVTALMASGLRLPAGAAIDRGKRRTGQSCGRRGPSFRRCHHLDRWDAGREAHAGAVVCPALRPARGSDDRDPGAAWRRREHVHGQGGGDAARVRSPGPSRRQDRAHRTSGHLCGLARGVGRCIAIRRWSG